jgi:hypothetical protein
MAAPEMRTHLHVFMNELARVRRGPACVARSLHSTDAAQEINNPQSLIFQQGAGRSGAHPARLPHLGLTLCGACRCGHGGGGGGRRQRPQAQAGRRARKGYLPAPWGRRSGAV